MQRIGELSDIPVDVRIAARLLAMSDAGGTVPTTLQELASEIGTAREVGSRTLERIVYFRATRSTRADMPLWPDPSLISASYSARCRMVISPKDCRSIAAV